jgi:hypothetical protein
MDGPGAGPSGFPYRDTERLVWSSLRESSVEFKKSDTLGATFLTVRTLGFRGPDYDNEVSRLVRLDVVSVLPDGTRVEWHHHQDMGVPVSSVWIASRGRYLEVKVGLMDLPKGKDAVIELARSLQFVPETRSIRHPSTRFEVEIPPRQLASSGTQAADYGIRINLRHMPRVDIYIYPAWESHSSLEAALQDIAGHFAKRGITGGPPQRLALPGGGTALFIEAPGTKVPYMAAVEREGRYFFVRASAEQVEALPANVWSLFRHAMGGVRPASD